MLDCFAPLTHLFWMLVEPALHRFETCSCFHRVMRRSLPLVQVFLMAQPWHALVQYRRKINPSSSFV
jgi:hypothetical protein